MGTTESILIHQSNGGSEAHSNRRATSTRRRTPKNVYTLKGILLGMPLSGKKSLLQRLQGKNPFDDNAAIVECTNVTVPYLAPGTTWDDQIQLHVEIPNTFQREPPDFCVVLVNPRYEWKSATRPYLLQVVDALLEHEAEQPQRRRSIALCFLLTFRDQQETSNQYTYEQIQESDLQQLAQEITRKHKHMMIRTGTTSLLNCYGLDTLHHFIYQAYLSKKQAELEQQLRQVQEQGSKTRAPKPVDYQEFVKQLEGEEEPASQGRSSRIRQSQRSEIDLSTTTSRRVMPVQQQRPAPGDGGREHEQQEEKGRQERPRSKRRQPPSRKGFPPKEPAAPIIPPLGTDPKKTLDAFFADDDSDEDDGVGLAQKSSDADDDEDDDFFYDDKQRRVEHVGSSKDSTSKTLKAPAVFRMKQDRGRMTPVTEQTDDEEEGVDSQTNSPVSKLTAISPVSTENYPQEMTVDSPVDRPGQLDDEDGDGGGWSDDEDIELSDNEIETSASESSRKGQKPAADIDQDVPEEKKEINELDYKDVDEAGDEDGGGWSDEDDILIDEDENDVIPPAVPVESKDGTSKSSKHHQGNEAVKEKEESSLRPAVPPASELDAADTTNSHPTTTTAQQNETIKSSEGDGWSDDDDDDDDEFMVDVIRDETPVQLSSSSPTSPTLNKPKEPPPSPACPTGGGMNAAVLAAIAAAEEDARNMLSEQEKHAEIEKEQIAAARKAKKKKTKEEKAAKKEKKAKRKANSSKATEHA